ncbi:MAG TPA: hypothetical protein VF173_00570 [Thermoanaerobaculia bacterium]|nr:hypothetical protein [Thermoanaerobaculia bacterium]
MAADLSGSTRVFLDACCVLNLYASGRMGEILAAFPDQWTVADAVLQEALYVRDDQPDEKQVVDLTGLIVSGLLAKAQLDTEAEMSLFVRFAADLGDGEAATCALAVSRQGIVATDDRKAIRLLGSLNPPGPALAIHCADGGNPFWPDAADPIASMPKYRATRNK